MLVLSSLKKFLPNAVELSRGVLILSTVEFELVKLPVLVSGELLSSCSLSKPETNKIVSNYVPLDSKVIGIFI